MHAKIINIFLLFQIIPFLKAQSNDTLKDYKSITYYSNLNEKCSSECFVRNTPLEDSNYFCNQNLIKNISEALQNAKKNTTFENNNFNISNAREINRVLLKYQDDLVVCEFTFLRTNCLYLKSNYTDSRCQWWDENDLIITSEINTSWVKLAANIANLIFITFAAVLLLYFFKKNKRTFKNQSESLKQKNRRFVSINEQLI